MGDVFNVPKSTISPEAWLQVPALIELEAMGSGPANFLTLLLSTLIRESLKVNPNADDKELRHVIFFEEAHNLIGPQASEVTGENADPKLAATAYIVKMLAEVRALNEGIIIADQLPTVMAPEVIKNTGLKIGHRLTAEDDRSLLGGTMSANPTQLEQMATYIPGEALVTFEGLLRPFKAQICLWKKDPTLYISPSNEDLSSLMSGKAGYHKLLQRSSQICYDKFLSEQQALVHEISTFIADNDKLTDDLLKVKNFLKENNINDDEFLGEENDNPLVAKAQESSLIIEHKKQLLITCLNKLFELINELLVKEKGYLYQNKAFRKDIALLLLQLTGIRAKLYSIVKQRYSSCVKNYIAFSKEMNTWKLSKILCEVNFDADEIKKIDSWGIM
jgi:hypothetical protein